MNSDSIPVDLITEIFSRLPAKSTTRFICLSKLWASMLCRPYFTELFLTRSSAKPHILFAIEEDGVWSFFSLPQRQNPYETSSSSLVVTAKFHMKFPPDHMKIYSSTDQRFVCDYASGLIYFYGVPVICNPNTGHYVTLPHRLRYKSYSFFGFDPIDKQFKVLFMDYPRSDEHKMRYRTIKCPLLHYCWSKGICINGVLYYLGYVVRTNDETYNYVIVCFDVRSEKFKFIHLQNFCTLTNYKGKLCLVYTDKIYWKDADDVVELRMWVLEDAEKEEWSKYAYSLRDHKFIIDEYFHVVGVTSIGEIILSMGYYESKKPFCVFYFYVVVCLTHFFSQFQC